MRRYWSEDDLRLLARVYPTADTAYIAEMFGVSPRALAQRARKEGIRKALGFVGPRFQKGLTPWNKGLSYCPPGSERGHFQKGSKPQTWKPVGTEKINKDGVLVRKISDTGAKLEDWQPVHKLVWEQHNGPTPADHIVVFVDKDKRNFAIENLLLVSRAENMRRNTIHRYPPELVSVMKLAGKLRRKINEKSN